MNEAIENGTHRTIDGVLRVFNEGYWIKYYEPPKDNLTEKKHLIQALTRRLFNHMEHGINIPGRNLEITRSAYESEQDPAKKRVKGAMLAGALFNRAADIFTHLVELEASGVEIKPGNDLMHTCGLCLREALEVGKLVKHRNGDEGIDELWGEPFKAFIMPIEEFYESRYMKIAMTMKNIDELAVFMSGCVEGDPRLTGLDELILNHAETAKRKCETLRTDEDIYDVWTEFVVAGEAVTQFETIDIDEDPDMNRFDLADLRYMLKEGVRLISFITRARTPMPLSTKNFRDGCERFKSAT